MPGIQIPRTNLVIYTVSNGAGKPASGPRLDRRHGAVQFQACPRTRPPAAWQAKPGPRPVNPRVVTALAWPVGSNLQLYISGCTIYHCIRICYCKLHIIDFGTSLSLFDVLATLMIKTNRDTLPTPSWKWASTELQQLLVVYPGQSGGQ